MLFQTHKQAFIVAARQARQCILSPCVFALFVRCAVCPTALQQQQ